MNECIVKLCNTCSQIVMHYYRGVAQDVVVFGGVSTRCCWHTVCTE